MEQVHPINILKTLSKTLNYSMLSEEFACELDQLEIWPNQRSKFYYPKSKDLPKIKRDHLNQSNLEQECIYLCGHSLGLQPKSTKRYIDNVLQQWAMMGVHGHFEGDQPWNLFENANKSTMANLVGAKLDEIGIMNFLSINLHLLMVSFYQPNQKRFKILIENGAFSSDQYAVESQIKLHNLKVDDCLISLKPRKDEHCLRTEDIIDFIEKEGDKIYLILFPGIQYFTGQLFKIKEITEAAHRKGCFIGFDLAHCVGNVELFLHEWGIDFAVWCTYKYLNSGPGSIGGLFLHEKHFGHKFPRLNGWWGNRLETRFKMSNQLESTVGASGYALSTGPSILQACLSSSLAIFQEIDFKELLLKSRCLSAYLVLLLNEKLKSLNHSIFEIITPSNPEERGSHLSIMFKTNIQSVFEELEKNGIVCDFRHPNVLRFAPVALYNTFHELFIFVKILEKSLIKCFPEN